MARVLKKHEFANKRRWHRFNYDALFDGRIWKLTSKDLQGQLPNLARSTVYKAAIRLGKRVRIEVGEDSLIVQCVGDRS